MAASFSPVVGFSHRHKTRLARVLACAALAILGVPGLAWADDQPVPMATQSYAIHAQATVVDQANAAFTSPYSGGNSLSAKAKGRETFDASVYVGGHLWRGAEVWVNPEIDQGFGLQNTLGAAGFPSGEAYKVGATNPYFQLHRLFIRQTIDLSGESQVVSPDLLQLGGTRRANRIVITLGKISVPDIFDANANAHDPRHDFLNWALIDTGSFDYAADAWGYSVGGAAEWYQGKWTLRGGVFDLSEVPNNEKLDRHFGQFQLIGELERRYSVRGQTGTLVITGFLTRGRMGRFDDAVRLSNLTGQPADVSVVRRYRSRTGIGISLQQQLSADLGVFLRAGVAGGAVEPYEFSDIDRTVAVGASLNGKGWGRAGDTLGLAGIVNDISAAHVQYLQAGGLGILVGDGQLPHPGKEQIVETYYDIGLNKYLHLAFDYQLIVNPAYNRDRGPINVFAARLHAQF